MKELIETFISETANEFNFKYIYQCRLVNEYTDLK